MLTGNSSRRDDIESLFYASFKHSFFSLPWIHLFDLGELNLSSYKKIEQIFKLKDEAEFLNQYISFPIQFKLAFRYVKSLTYYDRPDYVQVKAMMEECLYQLEPKTDDWDWII